MSFIQQFFTSRDNNANAETFVGQQGRLWWDPVTNQIYSSDGNTPGGIPLAGGGGGNGTPGGSNSQVQFNDSGAFGGTANLTINSATGALTAVSFVGDGSTLTNLTGANVVGEVAYAAVANSVTGANVSGAVANATYATTAGSATTANTAVTVTGNAQPNITSVGTLNSVSVIGNVDAGGLYVGGSGVVTGNLQIQGNLTYNNLTNITTANLVFGLANTSVGVSANGAGWVVGNTNQASWLYNYGTQLWNSNIGISAIGNIIGSNITTSGLISATGNVSGGNLRTTGVVSALGGIISSGEIYSATAITGGNVSGATVYATGNITGGNILTNGLISAAGNITGANLNANSLVIVSNNASPNFTVRFKGQGSGDQFGFITSGTAGQGTFFQSLNSAGTVYAPISFAGTTLTYNTSSGGSASVPTMYLYPNLVASFAGPISAVGNITGNYFIGNGRSLTGIVSSYGNANVVANLAALGSNPVSTTGNVTAGYFIGNGSQLANITAANVIGEVSNATYASSAVNAINAETVTANSQPNITGVGILTSLSVSGNVDAAYFIGNGSQLTGIASSSGNRIFNGSSNVEIATADGNATITTAGTSTWTFDTVGNLNLPGGNIVQSTNRDLNIVVQDADNDDFALQTIVDDGAGTTLSRIRQRRGDIQLGTGLATGSPHYWQFDNGGTLRLAGDVWGNAGGNLTVQIPISDANSFISLQTRDNTDTLKSNINVTTTNVTISTNTAGNTWVFDTTGNLQLPNQANISIDPEWGYTNLNSAPNSVISLQGIATSGTSLATVTADGEFGIVNVRVEGADEEFTSEWTFLPDGSIAFPYQKLLGNASQFSGDFRVISTANIAILANLNPTTADSGADGYLVEIGAGPGANSTVSGTASGHGGNVYIAAGSGGDTVDYANAGPGGTVYIQGGQTWNLTEPGGNIELWGGQGIYSTKLGNIRFMAGGAGNAEFSSDTGVFSAAGNIMTGNFFIGDGGLLSNISGGGIQTSIADGNSSVAVDGVDGNVLITTNGGGGGVWSFDTAGVLTLPGEGVVRSNNDTVVIQSYDTANAVGYGMYVGTAGGLYFQQASDPVWLSIAPNASNVEIAAGVAEGGAAGHNISITAGAADQTNYYATAGGNVNITGGLGAFNDGGGGGPGGSINISSGLSSDPAGVPGNVTVNTGPYTWNFDYNGTLNLPEGTAYIGAAANTLTLHANDSEAIYISAISGGISAETNGNITLISNVDGLTNYAWTFDNTGNLTAPGAISATGNITGGNITGTTASLSGNVTGGNLRTSGVLNLTGGAPYTTAALSGGNIILNNGASDSPGLHFYQGNNDNFGIDVEASTLRFVKNLDEAGGVVIGRINANGNISAVGQLQGASASVTGNVTGGNVIATTTVYGNAATAFVAGTAAISGVALQMPQEGALRNLNNGSTNMYFDVSTGGSTNGQFQFRSSNAFTNVLTMSPTAFNVNPNAVVTARTASFGRLAWNSAIDTELTIDNYRFRVSNQGGIFPQIISNTGGTVNSAWTVVASRSGSAINQTGSTGALLPNNSWTSLYTSAGMDSSGDTYVATLQDKSAGRIYRVTFMRSDNGATTGYNIIAERLI